MYNEYFKIIQSIIYDINTKLSNHPSTKVSYDYDKQQDEIRKKIHNTNKILKNGKILKSVNNIINYCKDLGGFIKKKIESQNMFLKTLFLFYKNLYNSKKKEFQTLSSKITKSESIRLQVILKIILFDVYIYNSLIHDEKYNKSLHKIINYIPSILNKINKDTAENYKNIITYYNFYLDEIMWKNIKQNTTEIKNKVKGIISDSIQEYIKLDHFYKDSDSSIKIESMENLYKLNFSNQKYDETQNIKILCYELINLFSRINLITFHRVYVYNF